MVPKNAIAVEILETVEPDAEVIKACRELKAAGYQMVLDDFVFHERYRPFVELADIIKVDFMATDAAQRKELLKECKALPVQFLAEKVETQETFEEAFEAGYSLFQGYFFSKPKIVTGRDIPGSKINYLRVLHEVNRPDAEFERIEEIIKRDVSLSYKLLRFINSAFFQFSVKVESIKHALILLGLKEIKKWVSVVALSSMGFDKPQELLTLSLIRARFCELLAAQVGLEKRAADLFMTGLFSLIDALIDRPMHVVLSDLPIAEDVKQALLGKDNPLRDVFGLVVAYERAEWNRASIYARKLRANEKDLPTLFLDSVNWASIAL
ncbi:MAG: HDOD domain-containing protein [Desulfobacterota bacterium]|nr:HDOD domain-containing protein [Thermodesulfobacteriota bacterium]